MIRPHQLNNDVWPLWARTLSTFKKPEDKGLGDVVERLAKETGVDEIAKIYEKITNKNCGCKERKENLNLTYPL